MTKYQKGANFERQVMNHLIEKGADVTRSAGSHTPKDVVAVFPGPIVYYIQCKTDGNLNAKERKGLLSLEKTHNIIPMLAYKEKGGIVLENIKPISTDYSLKLIDGKFIQEEK